LLVVFSAVLGLLVGSFLNVCILRIPRDESITVGRSHCMSCGHTLSPLELMPVFSWLALRGRCRSCGVKVSPRYLVVEALNAILYLLVALRFGFSWQALIYFCFVSLLLVVTFIDIDWQIIPDGVLLAGLLPGVLCAAFSLFVPWYEALLGVVVGGGSLLAVDLLGRLLFKKESMGGGDVKLLALIGLYIGWKLTLLSLVFAILSGALVGLLVLARSKEEERSGRMMPFGPFLALGAVVSLLWGTPFLHWYFSLLF
jgi:leader peptidase (prepilin peptidase)/N-methyltransferase